MRVALIQLPQKRSIIFIPAGLLCLASYIKQNGHQPIIIDLNILFKNQKFSANFFRKAAKMILSNRPQVIGFSVMCNAFPAALLIAKECKNLAPQIPIIFGGPEVSFEETEVLKTFTQVDIIVRGEGEITLFKVLEALEKKTSLSDILGISFRKNHAIVRNPDRPFIKNLDELPFLDYSLLLHLERYEAGQIEAGRGCPFQCSFCSTCKMWKRTFRIKSPERLAKELENLARLLKIHKNKPIFIEHDNLFTSRKVIENFLRLIADKGIAWSCSSRLEAIDEALVKKIIEAGCQGIFLGIESGSTETQKIIKKNLPLAKLPKLLDIFSRYNFSSGLSFIIGFPGENKTRIDQTLELALISRLHSAAPTVSVYAYTFLKGSEFYDHTKDNLSRAEFCQADISPVLTNLPAEVALIKKHPEIFPSFYFAKRKDFQPKFLERICLLFCFLIRSFPLTTFLLLKFSPSSPFELGQKIISFFDSTGVKQKTHLEETARFNYYLPLFKNFIGGESALLIKEVFKHEEFLTKNSLKKNLPRHKNRIKMGSRPKLYKDVKIKKYSYDISSLAEKLSTKQEIKIPKSACAFAYAPGEIAKAVPLNPLSLYLLQICNGKISVQQIMNEVSDPKDRTKAAKNALMEGFRYLQEQGIITTG